MAWPKNESAYFSRKIWVNVRNWQICKVEYYTTESEKEKTLILTDFIEKNGFITAGKMVMERGDGDKTIMKISSFKPDMGLNDEIFSRSFLIKI
jgi:outer membrane lipoprotein-sorting protein